MRRCCSVLFVLTLAACSGGHAPSNTGNALPPPQVPTPEVTPPNNPPVMIPPGRVVHKFNELSLPDQTYVEAAMNIPGKHLFLARHGESPDMTLYSFRAGKLTALQSNVRFHAALFLPPSWAERDGLKRGDSCGHLFWLKDGRVVKYAQGTDETTGYVAGPPPVRDDSSFRRPSHYAYLLADGSIFIPGDAESASMLFSDGKGIELPHGQDQWPRAENWFGRDVLEITRDGAPPEYRAYTAAGVTSLEVPSPLVNPDGKAGELRQASADGLCIVRNPPGTLEAWRIVDGKPQWIHDPDGNPCRASSLWGTRARGTNVLIVRAGPDDTIKSGVYAVEGLLATPVEPPEGYRYQVLTPISHGVELYIVSQPYPAPLSSEEVRCDLFRWNGAGLTAIESGASHHALAGYTLPGNAHTYAAMDDGSPLSICGGRNIVRGMIGHYDKIWILVGDMVGEVAFDKAERQLVGTGSISGDDRHLYMTALVVDAGNHAYSVVYRIESDLRARLVVTEWNKAVGSSLTGADHDGFAVSVADGYLLVIPDQQHEILWTKLHED